jgi:hypothetical protein
MRNILLVCLFIFAASFSASSFSMEEQPKLIAKFFGIENVLEPKPREKHFVGHVYIIKKQKKNERIIIAVFRITYGPNTPWNIEIVSDGKLLAEKIVLRDQGEFELPISFSKNKNAILIYTRWGKGIFDLNTLKTSALESSSTDTDFVPCIDLLADKNSIAFVYKDLNKHLNENDITKLKQAIARHSNYGIKYLEEIAGMSMSFILLNHFILVIEKGYSDNWRLFELASAHHIKQ